MFKNTTDFLWKIGFSFVLWVFILSIHWDGETLFDRSHKVLIENSLVSLLGEKSQELWEEILRQASEKYAELNAKDEDTL